MGRFGTRFGKYYLDKLLGRGGMGEVYEALDTEKNRTVALKILLDTYSQDAQFRERFTREAHVAAGLQEPHVIPIHDWGEIDGKLYIDMRLVRGTDLRKVLAAGPLDPGRAVAICSQIAEALDAAHAAALIHRDVKPENIVVTDSDFAYLLDFGIAEKAGDPRLTQTGLTVGSLAYIAPERLTGEQAPGAADVYSLACVLFECLTGGRPFPADSAGHSISAHLYSPPPAPSTAADVPDALDAVIARGMAKEPDDRYGSAGALMRAAQRALHSAPDVHATMAAPHVHAATDVHTRPAPKPAPAQSAPRPVAASTETGSRWVVPTVIGVAAALLLGGIGVTVGVLLGRGAGTDPAASPSPTMTKATIPVPGIATTARTPRVAAVPPVVRGLDPAGEDCQDGLVYPGGSGFGSRAARGSAETSCYFTGTVLRAYWQAGPPSDAPRAVSAQGRRACGNGDSRCDGTLFVMHCATHGSEGWITCTGGRNARVYLY